MGKKHIFYIKVTQRGGHIGDRINKDYGCGQSSEVGGGLSGLCCAMLCGTMKGKKRIRPRAASCGWRMG